MILRTTLTSPFGRKALMAGHHLGLMDRVEVIGSDPMKPEDPLLKDNPLGKMPALILEDGRRIYDSCVILEYFDRLAGGGKILPLDFDARIAALTLQALSDGVMDAALLVVYEGRYRPEHLHHEPWLDYQRGKIERGLDELQARPPNPANVTVGTIATACMFGYLDWRKQVDWRNRNPKLVEWLDRFAQGCPAFARTKVD
jgi:glutathione S-transferase